MPPKKVPAAPSKKTEQKKKEKIVEDKTFGLKNKKGAKQQKFIQQVQKQVTHGGNKSARQLEKEKEQLKSKKDDKKKEMEEISNLFKPVQQLASKGVDPKSVLCAFFKQGACMKGSKCKFSHDLTVERKSEKRSAYVDMREDKETSEDWDEATLKEVVEQKHGKEANKPTTEIICRYFLDAVENGKYGWFWECPNGEKCIYRHALPPGYVLKKDRKKTDKEKDDINLEELIEKERAALGFNTTRVTLETFLAWKKKKLKEKEEKTIKETAKKKNDYKSGKETGLSGREMFTFNPELAIAGQDMEEGDADFDLNNMEKDPEDEEEEKFQFREIDFNSLVAEYNDMEVENGVPGGDRLTGESVVAEDSASGAIGNEVSSLAQNGDSVAIDEDLFDGEDADLDELEEELEELSVT